ncbi:MAG TPA: transglutaminase domain-containing protein [Thermoanaerobaculia bacterium]|nr:transglutaminase domain-containing protein [Thermoanaerobaculia bacterium]
MIALVLVHLMVAVPVLATTGPQAAASAPGSRAAAESTAVPAEAALSQEEALARLDRFMQLIEKLRSHIDRSQFDLVALLDRLDYDPKRIVAFVKHEIYFEQYPGVLRGARGTLMSRAGNALDQSVLLATLLRDAGFDARVVRGTISATDASMLLEQIKPPRQPQALKDPDGFKAALSLLGEVPAGSIEQAMDGLTRKYNEIPIRPDLHSNADRISTGLRRALAEQGHPIQQKAQLPVDEARDYYWVESQLGPDKAWTEIHPALERGASLASASRVTVFAGEIPEELVQRVEISLIGERVVGKRKDLVELTDPWVRPAANLIGQPISLLFLPLGQYDSLEGLQRSLSDSDILVPIFNQSPAKHVVDLRGYFIPAAEAQSAAAGVIREGGEKVSQAVTALRSMGAPTAPTQEPATALTGLWVDYRIHMPGGERREFRRTIVDTLDREPEGNEWSRKQTSLDDLRKAILGTRQTMIETGHGCEAFKLEESLKAIQQTLALKKWYLEGQGRGVRDWSGSLPSFLPPYVQLGLFGLFDRGDTYQKSVMSYRSSPSILTIELRESYSPIEESRLVTTVDIVNNERRVYSRSGNGLAASPVDAVWLGVFETLEEEALESPEASRPWSAGRATLSAMESGQKLTVITPGTPDAFSRLATDSATKQAMQAELDAGFWLVTAPLANASSGRFFWWRVHPESGNALGMIETGQGASAFEYILTFTLITLILIAPVCFWGNVIYGFVVNPELDEWWDTLGGCMKLGIPVAGLITMIIMASPVLAYGGFVLAVALLYRLVF